MKVVGKRLKRNKSFNYVPSDTASTSSRSASVDPYRDEDDDVTPPPGFDETRRPSSGSEKFSESRSESFRGMVANDVPAPEYPPGLEVDGGKDEPTIPPPRSESFRGMVANGVEVPAYPPGLSVEGTEKRPSAAPPSSQPSMGSGKKELSETERTNMDIAQKTYDLLKQNGGGMTVKEIAGIIQLPKTNLRMHERAQVGVAVKAHSETFSLSSMNSGEFL
ncbi:hypothetical protein ANCCAN_25189 [Ancylostoma caninum]|uniref:Uncharacterized protein n=1 Tax=Ancylostoma caninum TaxID=29170 RepID=A0A368FE36_ANCCA|nr:hypothetical protein ANCCAN_25189 [Ancylostoma caninum]